MQIGPFHEMRGPLSSNLFRMPTADRFMEALIDDIRKGRTVFVLLPDSVELDLVWAEITRLLQRRQEINIRWREVYVSEMPRGEAPLLALAGAIQVVWPDQGTPRTVSNLLDLDECPDLLLLRGLGSLDEEEQDSWLKMIDRWETAGRSTLNRGDKPKGLVLIDKYKALKARISGILDTLTVRWWWGIPSALEMRQLCRLASSYEDDAEQTSGSRWREHVLPGLVGNDVELAEYIWDQAQSSGDELIERLASLAESREWAPNDLEAWGANDVVVAARKYRLRELDSPPFELLELWASGALSYSSEYGLELHPAANQILGQGGAIKRKIWRGQVELLSPILDNLRIDICQYLSRQYGDDWPVKWIVPINPLDERDSRDDPLATQWSHIVNVLNLFELKKPEKALCDQAQLARKIRNDIYHYDLVEFWRFDLLDKMIAG